MKHSQDHDRKPRNPPTKERQKWISRERGRRLAW